VRSTSPPVARYELLIDGAGRWRAQSEDDVRQWLSEYREEHAADDPDAAHVQIRKLSAWSWLTGGKLVPRQQFLVVLLLALVFAAPAGAAIRPGDTAAIDVSVATLWKAPNLYRSLDRPSITNPVDPGQWSKNLSTTSSRIWLDSHVQTQALYGQLVTVLDVRSGWAKIAVHDEPDPQDPRGYPGWVPLRQLKAAYDTSGESVVVVARTGQLLVKGRELTLSYGTRLPLVKWGGDFATVRTPDGVGTVVGVEEPFRPTNASIIAQAKRFLGVHYLWGGLSSWGFDCSGIVWNVYRAHGLTIPRDADPQMHHGTPVGRSALRPGDLLFFGSPGYADHVTIYLGNDVQLEAPDSAHRVRISPVRWAHYIGARRYLTR
jgi:gamma-D-glutamyl-L-lysine dipeptidyl-peptidase